VLAEGVTWFSDSGQAGPPDGSQATDDGDGDVDGGSTCRAGGSTRSGRTSPLALLLALGLLRRRKLRSSAG
jgi:hypothetical protein